MSLKKAPAVLLAKLPPLDQVLRGSLLHRKSFHSGGCAKCAAGVGHLQWVINVNYPGGRTKQVSIRPDQVAHVKQLIANYRRIKDALETLSEMNLQNVRGIRDEARQGATPARKRSQGSKRP